MMSAFAIFVASLPLSSAFVLPAIFRGSAVSRNRSHLRSETENRFWEWRGQKIRYVVHGEENLKGPSVIMVHGLFVNADHFRKNLPALAKHGIRAYGIDLLGNGYSSKPPPCGDEAQNISGERFRSQVTSGLKNVELGTPDGKTRRSDVSLSHPVTGSVYNFFTWAEQLADFATHVVKPSDGKVILVCNSIGTISSLQAAIDAPGLFDGVFVINPNFRELHVAESPRFIQPAVQLVQRLLRENGQPLFDALANTETVKSILKEPYSVTEAVTDELVDVLLTPLLLPGSADVVFDTLSYSAGPLPEQQLQDSNLSETAVEVCYGEEDPWTPLPRVRALTRYAPVGKVIPLPGVGHCPHDEAPELVNPLVVDFVQRVASSRV